MFGSEKAFGQDPPTAASCEDGGTDDRTEAGLYKEAFDFDFQVEEEIKASARLGDQHVLCDRKNALCLNTDLVSYKYVLDTGRAPLLSELRLQKPEAPKRVGVPVEINGNQPSLGHHDSKDNHERKKNERGDGVSEEIDEELSALKERLSARATLSLGHSMLRTIDRSLDPMETCKHIQNHEEIGLQLQCAAEDARQKYRRSIKTQHTLNEEAVGRVKHFAQDWGDRERRIGEYLGIYARFWRFASRNLFAVFPLLSPYLN